MSAVDVLAVMDAAIESDNRADSTAVSSLFDARAAVAELLEALGDFDGMDEANMPGTPTRLRRLRLAYARVQGASA